MTVSAQNLQITSVCPPVLNPARPRPFAAARADLGGRVDVVQFKNTHVVYAACDALSAKILNYLAFDLPIGFLPPTVRRDALAFGATISVKAFCATFGATALTPSAPCVASMRTEPRVLNACPRWLDVKRCIANLARAVFAIGLSVWRKTSKALIPSRRSRCACTSLGAKLSSGTAIELNAAFFAGVDNRLHWGILAAVRPIASYFDIACKRVEDAYRQPDMFAEAPKKAEQAAMFGGRP